MRNVVPSPSRLCTEIWPSWPVARAILSPSPTPGIAALVARWVRKKRWNSCCMSASEIPIPVSLTSSTARSSSHVSRTTTRPPSGVNLIAFETRLSSAWARRSRSPRTSGTSVDSSVSSTPPSAARGAAASTYSRERGEVDVAFLEAQLASLDPGDEKQVADEPQQAPRVAVDDDEDVGALTRGRVVAVAFGVVAEQLEVADDGRQGRAQLVRDERGELVLHARRLAPRGHVAQHDDPPVQAHLDLLEPGDVAREDPPGAGVADLVADDLFGDVGHGSRSSGSTSHRLVGDDRVAAVVEQRDR